MPENLALTSLDASSDDPGRLVLVTGGTGYVASWCIVELLQRGYRVRTTVRSLTRSDAVRAAVASEVPPGDRLSFAVADLTSDAGWPEALDGVDGVLHVASPLGNDNPRDADELIRPAVDGTLRLLRAAAAAGVPRVVVTSSGAAATSAPKGDVRIDDALWTNADEPGLTAYRRSKVLAERAAWDFAATHPDLQLVTVLPGAIFGPALPGASESSLTIIRRMLDGAMPAVPRIEMAIVDVRDLAVAHVQALETPDAAGHRFLAVGEVLSMPEIGRLVRGLGTPGRKAPVRTLPDAAVRLLARFNTELAPLLPMLGRRITASADRAERVLGWRPRPAVETITDSARYLLASGSGR